MARYHGKVGYGIEDETSADIYELQIQEHFMKGDIIANKSSNQDNGKINGDIVLRSKFSLIFDAFAKGNFQNIKYITYNGVKWEVSDIDISQKPRIILTVGGVWNGN